MSILKKSISLLIALLMIISLFVILPIQTSAVSSGKTGDVDWRYNGLKGLLTISGNGSMQNYNSVDLTPWYEFIDDIKAVDVQSGVENLGDDAFAACRNLTTATIADTVKTIGDHTFSNCISLENISELSNVTSIGNQAFYNCEKLRTISIPKCISFTGIYTFAECLRLEKIELAEGINSIIERMFYKCSTLNSIVIPDGVTSISGYAFCECSSLSSVTIPKSVTSIGDLAFDGCEKLKNVYYEGTEEDWDMIEFGKRNTPLADATMHFNAAYTVAPTQPEEQTQPTQAVEPTQPAEQTQPTQATQPQTQVTQPTDAPVTQPQTQAAVTSLKINADKTSIHIGEQAFISVTVENGVGSTSFSSTFNNVATVSSSGVVTGIGVGQTSIIVENNGKTAIVTINVTEKPDEPTQPQTQPIHPTEAVQNQKKDISGWQVLGLENKTYNGKEHTQTIFATDGHEIATVKIAYVNNKNAGTANIIITGTDDYTGTIIKTFKINKAANPMTVKAASKNVKYKTVRKKSVKVSSLTVKKAQGKVVYKKLSGSSKLTINSKGKVTVKKGTKKSTYTVKVKVTAKGNANYKSVSKTVTVKVKIK